MKAKGILAVLIVLLIVGCGGAEPDVASGYDEASTSASAGSNSSSEKDGASTKQASSGGVDKQATEAKQFCEHEVKKAAQKPLELLDRKQISACLIALRPEIKADCAKGVKREIVLKIIVGKDGSVVGAFPIGDGADSAEAGCVADKVRPVVFPAFTSKEQMVVEKYPFEIVP